MPAARAPLVEEVRLDIEAIYHLHGSIIAGWVANLGGPAADVEDLVQEVFVAVQEQLPRFKGRSRLTTWLYRITANVVSNRRRRKWFGREQSAGLDALIASNPPADENIAAAERRLQVYAVLDRLKEKHREVLVLFEIEERSGEEVAELLDVRLDTLWVRLHRARAEFLKQLELLDFPDLLKSERSRGAK
jgi:RNA polymerase sigma-70 factor (ECF subfamily)